MHAVCARRATFTTLTLAAHAHAADRVVGSRAAASAAALEKMACGAGPLRAWTIGRTRAYNGTHLHAPLALARHRHATASLSTVATGAGVGASPPGDDRAVHSPAAGGEEASATEKVAEAILAFVERDTDVNTPLPALKYPVVLCHGYLGYASLIRAPGSGAPLLEYFGSVRGHLGQASNGGITVITPVNPPAASIAARAKKLRWALGLQSGGEQAAAGKNVEEKPVGGSGEHTERKIEGGPSPPGGDEKGGSVGVSGNGNGNGAKGFVEHINTMGQFDASKHASDSASPEQHRAEEEGAAAPKSTAEASAPPPHPSRTIGGPKESGTSIILGGQQISLSEYKGKFHFIAHSMGGLDCRYMIAQLQAAGEAEGDPRAAARRVASLTTVGTPHRGSPVADAILDVIDVPLSFNASPAALAAAPTFHTISARLAGAFGIDVSGLANLSTQALRGFNQRVHNAPGVQYLSVGGAKRFQPWSVWYFPSKWIHQWKERNPLEVDACGLGSGGENDGLVAVDSARWGRYIGTTELDHLEQIGLGLSNKHLPLYRQMVFRLAEIEAAEEQREKGTQSGDDDASHKQTNAKTGEDKKR